MKILNLHGLDGTSDNTNYNVLKSLGYEVISPQLNDREMSLQEVSNILFPIVRSEKIDLIVATSYGAFFGKRISDKFSLPCIFTNPCLRPDISLEKIAPEYFTFLRRRDIHSWAVDQRYYDFSKDYIIIGDQDEVIDHYDITLFEASGAKFHHVEGGKHQLQIDKYDYLMKKLISDLKNA